MAKCIACFAPGRQHTDRIENLTATGHTTRTEARPCLSAYAKRSFCSLFSAWRTSGSAAASASLADVEPASSMGRELYAPQVPKLANKLNEQFERRPHGLGHLPDEEPDKAGNRDRAPTGFSLFWT